MKKLLMFLCFITYATLLFAQDNKDDNRGEKKSGFKKENLFTGGGVSASFFNGTTVLGITPHFGYSLTRWADVGFVFNLNYTSQRDYADYGDKLRQTVYGPGAFVRLFPVRFLFAQAQYEYNTIHLNYIPATGGSYAPAKTNLTAGSLLLGAGYTSGRSPGNNNYYYLSVLFDVLAQPNSPYVDNLQRSIPIIKAGYNIALFQGRHRRR
ncbi:MAG: hypothetical protein H0W12_00485 [Chitinophagaceae bacterium]|nr:hypothetical protein [Chitinophagaceae bacterium]